MNLKAVSTEKAIRMIEIENTITFETDRQNDKNALKKELEQMFSVKVDKIRTHISKNKKIAFVKLKKESSAADLATKLGLI
jgi:large subunit ribosomal protein L23